MFPVTTLSAYLCCRLESPWGSGVCRRQQDGGAVPRPGSGSGWDRISWQSSLGWPGPRNILQKKETVLNSQPGQMLSLKPEIISAFTLHGLNFWVWPQVLRTSWVTSFFQGCHSRQGAQLHTSMALVWSQPWGFYNLMAL